MHLYESQIYDFDCWMVIWGKRTRPLTRGVPFLECLLIRDSNAFVSFPFSLAWAGYQCSSSKTTLPVFVVTKIVFGLSDIVDSEGNGTGEISNYFSYHIHNFTISTNYLIRFSFSQTITKWDHENLGNLSPSVPSNPPTLPQLFSRTSRGIRKNFYLYQLINSCFFYFLLESRILCQLII